MGDKLAFVNISEEMLHSELLQLLPPAKAVFELESLVAPSNEVLEHSQFLRQRGYRIALKDNSDLLVGSALIDYTDYVEINILAYSMDEVARRFLEYQILGVTVLPERVEHRNQYEACSILAST